MFRHIILMVIVAVIVLELTGAKIIDLTHDHTTNILMSEGSPKYKRTLVHTGDIRPGVYCEFFAYNVGEHGGTHMDAPNHFKKGARSLSEIPIEDTIVEGVMVDCAEEAAKNSLYKVPLAKLTEWEKNHGRIPDGAGVIFNFNRSSKFTDPKSYYDTDNLADGLSYKFPSVSIEAAEWMARERNVKVLASDMSSIDLNDSQFPVHVLFLGDNRMLVENLKNPDLLPPRNFRFHFSPVKFVGGTGVQVRAYAMTYDDIQGQNRGGARIAGGWCVSAVGTAVLFVLSRVVLKVLA